MTSKETADTKCPVPQSMEAKRGGGNDKVPVSEFQAAGPSVPPCSLDGEPHRAVELGQTRFLQNSQK
ncbi:unnamed protein product [Boreogadus saida]